MEVARITASHLSAGYYYRPDPALYSHGSSLMAKIRNNFSWNLVNYRHYYEFNDANCFDTKEAALAAIDRLLFDNICSEIDEQNKEIQKLNERIEFIKNIKVKKTSFKKLVF